MSHKENAKKIEDLFETQIFPLSDQVEKTQVLDAYYQDFLSKGRENAQPVINYLYTVSSLIPGFVLSMISGNDTPPDPVQKTEVLSELLKEYGDRFQDQDLLPTLIKDRFGSEISNPGLLDAKELQNVLVESEVFTRQVNGLMDDVFNRLAKNAGIFPGFLIAKIASIALTPYMSAKICERMPIKESTGLAKHFDDDFLGNITNFLAPAVTAEIAGKIPFNRVNKIVSLLNTRGSYSTMAEIYDQVTDDLAQKLFHKTVTDSKQRASIIQFMQNEERINDLAGSFSEIERESIRTELKELGYSKLDMIPV